MEIQKLKQLQSLPLEAKIRMTINRIEQWYNHWDGDVYVSFSGGKDSQVLLHIARKLYHDIDAVFVNTGMEYPDLVKHVKTFENVTWLKPKMSFWKVVEKYGWPAISKENSQKISEINSTKSDKLKNKRLFGDKNGSGKLPEKWKPLIGLNLSHQCCNVLKKKPVKKYEKQTGLKPMIATMADESRLRGQREKCNMFEAKRPTSAPLTFWTEKDIWEYINKYDLKLAKPYYQGESRTGCMFCLFGQHLCNTPRFERIKTMYPKLYNVFLKKGGLEIYKKVMNCHKKDNSIIEGQRLLSDIKR